MSLSHLCEKETHPGGIDRSVPNAVPTWIWAIGCRGSYAVIPDDATEERRMTELSDALEQEARKAPLIIPKKALDSVYDRLHRKSADPMDAVAFPVPG